MRKVLLIILDGWGHSDFKESPTPGNAIEFASVPHFRELYDHCPRTRLACSGVDVGLPADQMGEALLDLESTEESPLDVPAFLRQGAD